MIQLITVISFKTYLSLFSHHTPFRTWSVPGTALIHIVLFHLLEPYLEGSMLSPFYRWENSGLEILVISLDSVLFAWFQSLWIYLLQKLSKSQNFMEPNWTRHMVWLKGNWKACPSALKISLLQEDSSRRTQTLQRPWGNIFLNLTI